MGIADWGPSQGPSAAYHPTTTHFPELPDQEASTKLAWIRSYKHVAPECFSENPPPYSPAQEVYSLSHQIKRLLDSLPPINLPLLTRFVRSMYKKVEAAVLRRILINALMLLPFLVVFRVSIILECPL